jgi:hypothetical protein
MKKLAMFLALMNALGGAYAQSEPVVGLWEKIAVAGPGGKLVARTSYIFTNQKLTEETVFTAFQNVKPMSLICCIKVKNLRPVELKDVLKKYSMDDEFVAHLKSVKGVPFMYEAVPVEKKDWNPLMNNIMSEEDDPDDQVPLHAPVIAAKLSKDDVKPGEINLGQNKAYVKVTYKDGKASYQFTINNKQTTFSDETFGH